MLYLKTAILFRLLFAPLNKANSFRLLFHDRLQVTLITLHHSCSLFDSLFPKQWLPVCNNKNVIYKILYSRTNSLLFFLEIPVQDHICPFHISVRISYWLIEEALNDCDTRLDYSVKYLKTGKILSTNSFTLVFKKHLIIPVQLLFFPFLLVNNFYNFLLLETHID